MAIQCLVQERWVEEPCWARGMGRMGEEERVGEVEVSHADGNGVGGAGNKGGRGGGYE